LKAALVTGATRGAGRAIAVALAMAGWRTYALGRDRAVLDEMRAGCGVQPLAMDLTDRDDLRVIAGDMRLDALIHAPLRWPQEGRFVDLREADIDMALEVNLSATLHLTHAILPSMIAARSGHIVLISPGVSSDRSLVRATVGSAVAAFADGLRSEFASSGVTIQTLDPGMPPFEGMAQSLVKSLGGRD
jgi:NADP-dependent 3-hydroxy acid dehydrogenase YdfG